MRELQDQFLRLYILETYKYKDIAEKLHLNRSTLTQWYEDLKDEREKMACIRKLWLRKKIPISCASFYDWYISHERKCHYCEISELEIEQLIAARKLETKRLPTRGRKLELDRKSPNQSPYNINNIVFACYWCNNAKTDTFTDAEFLRVGKIFKEIWKERLEKISI